MLKYTFLEYLLRKNCILILGILFLWIFYALSMVWTSEHKEYETSKLIKNILYISLEQHFGVGGDSNEILPHVFLQCNEKHNAKTVKEQQKTHCPLMHIIFVIDQFSSRGQGKWVR